MRACEEDETWQTLRGMRQRTKNKFLTCVCIMVQEEVEDLQQACRFRNWACKWGEDEADACMLHNSIWGGFQKHIIGITAAQFVWGPMEEGDDGSDEGTPPAASDDTVEGRVALAEGGTRRETNNA